MSKKLAHQATIKRYGKYEVMRDNPRASAFMDGFRKGYQAAMSRKRRQRGGDVAEQLLYR